MLARLLLAAGLAATLASSAFAWGTVYHRGYVNPNTGTYVQPHYQTAPNDTRLDNWSTRGNVNPYTGRPGTVDPYRIPVPAYGTWR